MAVLVAACARPSETDLSVELSACAPDEAALVFAGTTAGASGDYPVDLVVLRGDGSLTRLTEPDPTIREVDPALAPESGVVYFARGPDGEAAGGPPTTTEIWRYDLRSDRQEVVMRGAEELRTPTPSPDGALLAFVAREQRADAPGRRLYVVPVEGGARALLGPEDPERVATYDSPAWRPDGQAIAYVRSVQRDDGSITSEVRQVDVSSGRVTMTHRAPEGAQIGSCPGRRTAGRRSSPRSPSWAATVRG